MKNKIIILFCLIALNSYSTDDYNINNVNPSDSALIFASESAHGDTLTKRKVFQVDENLIVSDTIVIEKKKNVIKTIEKEKPNYKGLLISIFALSFAILSIVIKLKNNG